MQVAGPWQQHHLESTRHDHDLNIVAEVSLIEAMRHPRGEVGARHDCDEMLRAAGWLLLDSDSFNVLIYFDHGLHVEATTATAWAHTDEDGHPCVVAVGHRCPHDFAMVTVQVGSLPLLRQPFALK